MRDHRLHAAASLVVVQDPVWLDQHTRARRDQRSEGTFVARVPREFRSDSLDSTSNRRAVFFGVRTRRDFRERERGFEVVVEIRAHTNASESTLTSLTTGRHLFDFVRTTDSFNSISICKPGRFAVNVSRTVRKLSSLKPGCGTSCNSTEWSARCKN